MVCAGYDSTEKRAIFLVGKVMEQGGMGETQRLEGRKVVLVLILVLILVETLVLDVVLVLVLDLGLVAGLELRA